MDLNKAMLIGRLTRDPETRTTPNGKTVANFGIATNQRWTDASGERQEKVEYHNVVVWGKLADICNQYLAKGKKVFIEGRLQTRDWEGQDGIKRYRTEIVADNMIMLDRAPSESNFGNEKESPEKTVNFDSGGETKNEDTAAEQDGDEEITVEKIPF